MWSRWRGLERRNAAWPQDGPALAVAHPGYVIGDIHGSLGPLEALLGQILEDWGQDAALPVTFLGDYVDRGEQSREVVQLLRGLAGAPGWQVICLRGNHEQMLLRFLENPERAGPQWLRNGGLQTLASYGVGAVPGLTDGAGLEELAGRFREAIGAATIKWMQALPLQAQNGNLVMVHAGIDPELPMAAQEKRSLLWGHPAFLRQAPGSPLWVAHGHTIVEAPGIQDRRIALDTGAFATGKLSAAFVSPGAPPRFLQGMVDN